MPSEEENEDDVRKIVSMIDYLNHDDNEESEIENEDVEEEEEEEEEEDIYVKYGISGDESKSLQNYKLCLV